MSSSFHHSIIDAVESDSAPRFNLSSVRQRAERQSARSRGPRKRSAIVAALLLGVPCLAVASVLPSPGVRNAIVAQMQRWGVAPATRVSFLWGAAADPKSASGSARFHLVLPSGLPQGSRLVRFDANGPSGKSYTASYRLSNGEMAWFSVQKAVPNATYVPWIAFMRSDERGRVVEAVRYPARVWLVGDEVVFAAGHLTVEQLASIERSMNGRDAPLHRGAIQ